MEECVCYALLEYYEEHVGQCHEENFEDEMVDNVASLLQEQFGGEVDAHVEVAKVLDLFRCMVPLRTGLGVPPTFLQSDLPDVLARCRPAFAQRTAEWYAYRREMMTASNIYKALGSEAEVNQLIVEKCSPPPPEAAAGPGCASGARNHGVKYEPLSVVYYEHTYGTQVATDFSCVPHPQHPFIGASPDGVNILSGSPLYGRMLEVKNTVSREITGNPKREYWVQMQVQMEVLGLEWCDLLETHFVQYESRAEFDADGTFSQTADGKAKGVVLQYFTAGVVEYAYAPWGCTEEEFVQWEREKAVDFEAKGSVWGGTLYWKLDEAHCSLVQRNRKWFEANFASFKRVWETIQAERANGEWALRLPKKRPPKVVTKTEPNKCLLDL
jgi:putative phage-type endonuclease